MVHTPLFFGVGSDEVVSTGFGARPNCRLLKQELPPERVKSENCSMVVEYHPRDAKMGSNSAICLSPLEQINKTTQICLVVIKSFQNQQRKITYILKQMEENGSQFIERFRWLDRPRLRHCRQL